MTARNGSSPPSIHRPKPDDREAYFNGAMRQVVDALKVQQGFSEKDEARLQEARDLKRDALRGVAWRRQHA
jgi:hypothetical protein